MTKRLNPFIISLAGVAMVGLTGVSALAATPITLMHCYSGGREKVMQNIVNEFMQAHPEIAVTIDFVGCGDSSIHQKFVTESAAGVPPDVIMINSKHLPAYVKSGLIAPLDPYFATLSIQTDDYVPAALDAGLFEGKHYNLRATMPGTSNPFLFYNTDEFSQAGVSAQTGLTDWAALRTTTIKLTELNGDGTIKQLGFNPDGPANDNFLAWTYNNGGSFLDESGRHIQIGDAASIDTLRWMIDLQSVAGGYGNIMGYYGNLGGATVWNYDPFYKGAQSILVTGSWMFGYLATNAPDLAWGVAPRPANQGQEARPISLSSWGFGVSTGSKHPKEAMELVKWLTYNPGAVAEWNRATSAVPSLRSVLHDNSFWVGHSMEPYLDTVYKIADTVVSLPLIEVQPKLSEILGDAVGAALQGKETPGNALAKARTQMQATLDTYLSGQ